MLKSGSWLLAPLLILPSVLLMAQEGSPTEDDRPSVDQIKRVPAPKIPTGGSNAEGFSMPESIKINNIGGQISGDNESGIRFGGPVKITGDNGLEMFADTAQLDLKAKTVTLEGKLSIYQGDTLQRGDKAVYHYETGHFESTGLRASYDPILLESGKFTSTRKGDRRVLIGKDAGITTDDSEHPGFWIRAEETRVYPEDKVTFKNLRVYSGDTPVFWLPYLAQPLDAELGYHFLPGTKSSWGPYLLNTYGIMLGGETDPVTGDKQDAWLLSRWHFDLRAKRGVGVGVDLADIHSDRNDEITGLGLYYMHDLDPNFSRTGVVRQDIDPERYNIEFKNRILLDELEAGADWRLDTNVNYFSDQYYLEDLDEGLYTRDPAPDNTIGLFRRNDSSLLSIYTRYQVNDFYRADSRLPEVVFDLARAPLFDLPLLNEGSISLGLLGERTADGTKQSVVNPLSGLSIGDPGTQALLNELSGYERLLAEEMISLPLADPRRQEIRKQLVDSRFARFHVYDQVSMPMMIGDAISLTPKAGFGYTRYDAVDGPADSFDRTHFHLGTEAAVKFTRDYSDIQNHSLGLDGLMHVIQPYVNWSYIATTNSVAGDPMVDRLSPSTRPRPLDPARFTAIDEMQGWNIVRLGTRNRLITRRDEQSFEWLYLNTYMDMFVNDPEGERSLSNLYNDFTWRPVPWMDVELDTQVPIVDGGSGYSEFASRTRFMPSDQFEFSLGYRWLNGHPFLPDSSRIDLRTYSRINQDWGFGTRHGLELDDNTLEYQQYTIHRDLGQWVAGIGVTSRDNRLKEEFGMVFMLTLKDFPSVSLPFEFDGQ